MPKDWLRKVRDWFPKKKTELSKKEIEKILPHRGDKLLLDRVVISPKILQGELQVREELCLGHAVAGGELLFRGVDVAEMAAQLAGFVWGHQHEDYRGMIGLLKGVDGLKIRKPVFVGSMLVVEIDLRKIRQRIFGGPEVSTMRVVLQVKDILARVEKEQKARIGSLGIVMISLSSFLKSFSA